MFPLLIATPSVSASSKMRTEHIRAIDKSRLSGYITDMGADDLAEIERALCKLLRSLGTPKAENVSASVGPVFDQTTALFHLVATF